jgi:hypothetical protein
MSVSTSAFDGCLQAGGIERPNKWILRPYIAWLMMSLQETLYIGVTCTLSPRRVTTYHIDWVWPAVQQRLMNACKLAAVSVQTNGFSDLPLND